MLKMAPQALKPRAKLRFTGQSWMVKHSSTGWKTFKFFQLQKGGALALIEPPWLRAWIAWQSWSLTSAYWYSSGRSKFFNVATAYAFILIYESNTTIRNTWSHISNKVQRMIIKKTFKKEQCRVAAFKTRHIQCMVSPLINYKTSIHKLCIIILWIIYNLILM